MGSLQKNRVVVAMSGGVDSSVAASLLKEQGYDVIGISMKTHENPDPESLPSAHAAKNCCSVDDIHDARAVCRKLDIPFYAMNFKKEFQSEVMDYFAKEYAAGRTPNPCVKCNDLLKFKGLLKQAQALGARYLATGHYVRKMKDEGGKWHLLKARDTQKDQSYFLFGLGQDQLASLLFPLGELTKKEVRTIAHRAGIQTAEKPESQEICFVPNNDYVSTLEKLYPKQTQPTGTFRHQNGTMMGEHRGTHAYTIGQRRGLNIATGKRLYVTAIDSEANEVVLGSDEALYSSSLQATKVHWVTGPPEKAPVTAQVKIRYRHDPTPAEITLHRGDTATITFSKPQRAITPGQAVVFYQDNELLGGGWIES